MNLWQRRRQKIRQVFSLQWSPDGLLSLCSHFVLLIGAVNGICMRNVYGSSSAAHMYVGVATLTFLFSFYSTCARVYVYVCVCLFICKVNLFKANNFTANTGSCRSMVSMRLLIIRFLLFIAANAIHVNPKRLHSYIECLIINFQSLKAFALSY